MSILHQINKGVGATVRGSDRVVSALKKADFETEKALNTAVRVEGYRLKKELQKEIRHGAPGGHRFAPLSYISRRYWSRRPNRSPLDRLAVGIRYHVFSQKPFEMAVGWVGPDTGGMAKWQRDMDPFGRGIKSGHVTSKSWRWLGKIHQEGFERNVSDKQRQNIVAYGAELGTIEGGDTPFFLKKSTKVFHTPARPIINPFWAAHRRKAIRNIEVNFKRKMKGVRI